jgi:hypothetical protein
VVSSTRLPICSHFSSQALGLRSLVTQAAITPFIFNRRNIVRDYQPKTRTAVDDAAWCQNLSVTDKLCQFGAAHETPRPRDESGLMSPPSHNLGPPTLFVAASSRVRRCPAGGRRSPSLPIAFLSVPSVFSQCCYALILIAVILRRWSPSRGEGLPTKTCVFLWREQRPISCRPIGCQARNTWVLRLLPSSCAGRKTALRMTFLSEQGSAFNLQSRRMAGSGHRYEPATRTTD